METMEVKGIIDLPQNELKIRILATQKYIRIIFIPSLIILLGCALTFVANLGWVAHIASAFVLGSLAILFSKVLSELAVLKFELSRREISASEIAV